MTLIDTLKKAVGTTKTENRAMRRASMRYNRGAEGKQMHLNRAQVSYIFSSLNKKEK